MKAPQKPAKTDPVITALIRRMETDAEMIRKLVDTLVAQSDFQIDRMKIEAGALPTRHPESVAVDLNGLPPDRWGPADAETTPERP